VDTPIERFLTGPTPLEPAPRLALALGLAADDLWIKRDDLIGLGAGGNKARKLQYTCTEAISRGSTTLITTGAPQSNHARLTAAAGARLGLDVVLVLSGAPPASLSGNLALDGLFGATIVWTGDEPPAAQAQRVADDLEARGQRTTLIPLGGSNALGARGYVDCADEILTQLPDVALIVTAVGSGGTMAGLVHRMGAKRVLGVDVGAVPDPSATVLGLLRDMGPHAGELSIRGDQVGTGYPHLTDAVKRALLLAARTEGIVLDPIYTGRALAGLHAAVTDGSVSPGRPIVFLHSGGLPGLFGHPAAIDFLGQELRTIGP
jgi:L-cysteate sulfo-lyase